MSVTVTEGYVFVTSASVTGDSIGTNEGSDLVKITCGRGNVTHNYSNDMFFNPIPNLNAAPDPRILNLSKINEAITVQGVLRRKDLTEAVGSRTPIQKKSDLITISKGAQPVTIVWGVSANSNQQKHTDFHINKVQFKEVAGDVAEGTAREKIEVTLQGLLGSSLTS